MENNPSVNHHLDDEKDAQIKAAFDIFDKDKDGRITLRELGIVLRSLGQNPTEAELQQLINEWDKDGNGNIDYDEFVVLMTQQLNKAEEESREEMKESWAVFDREHKGYVASSDLRHVFDFLGSHHGPSIAISEEEIEEMMLKLDLNGDGKITYQGSVL